MVNREVTYSQNLDVVAFVLQIAPKVLQPGLDLKKRSGHSVSLWKGWSAHELNHSCALLKYNRDKNMRKRDGPETKTCLLAVWVSGG